MGDLLTTFRNWLWRFCFGCLDCSCYLLNYFKDRSLDKKCQEFMQRCDKESLLPDTSGAGPEIPMENRNTVKIISVEIYDSAILSYVKSLNEARPSSDDLTNYVRFFLLSYDHNLRELVEFLKKWGFTLGESMFIYYKINATDDVYALALDVKKFTFLNTGESVLFNHIDFEDESRILLI